MKILGGYDRSSEARDALKLARKHAKVFDAKIEVVKSITGHHPLDQNYSLLELTTAY